MNRHFKARMVWGLFTIALVPCIILLIFWFGQTPAIAAVLISMLSAAIAASIIALSPIQFLDRRRARERKESQLPPRIEQAKEEVLRLEQQKSELEKQRSELERKQQTLMWQMEAATLAKEDPQLAIITAYQGVETELQRVVNQLYPTDIPEEVDKQKLSVLYNLSLLEKHKGSSEILLTIKQMRDLRNRIIHAEVKQDEVSVDQAVEYVQRAINITRIISALGEYTPVEPD